jgi:TP901 family phage tail tape measure protein
MSDLNRKINIYLDGKQVENSVKTISSALNKLVNEQRLMTVGADDYLAHAKKIVYLRGLLEDHKRQIGAVASEWGKMKDVFKANLLANLTGQLATDVLSKVANAPKQIVNEFSQFQKGFSNTETNMAKPDIEKYSAGMKEAVKQNIELGQSVDDVNKAMFDSISSGIEAAESRKFLTESSEMAIGGNASLATSVDALTTIINAYSLKTSEAKNISGAFFAAQVYGKTTVQELAENVGEIIPIAKSLGVSYQEVLSSTSALTLGGLKTTMAVTYLKGALKSLLRPTVEAIPYMRQLGIPMGVTEVRAVGLGKALQKFTEAVKKYPDVVAKAIPDIEGLSAVLAMSGDGFQKYNEILGVANDRTKANAMLSDAYAIKQNTVSQTIERLKGQLSVAAINLGEKLAPAYMKVMEILGSFMGKMIKAGEWTIEHAAQIQFLAKVLLISINSYLSYIVVQKLVELWSKRMLAAKLLEKAIFTAEVIWIRLSTAATSLYSLAKAKLTGDTIAATRALSMFNTVVRANPLGILASLIGAIGTAYMMFKGNVEEATAAQEKFNQVTQDAIAFDKRLDMIHKQGKMLNSLDVDQLQSFKTMATEVFDKLDLNNKAIISDVKRVQAEVIAEINDDAKLSEAQKLANINVWKDVAANEILEKQKFYDKDIKALAVYISRADELLKKKTPKVKTQTTGGGDVFTKDQELKKRLLDEYTQKYQDFLSKLKQMRTEFNMQDMNENEREIVQIRQKFDEEIRLIRNSKTELIKKANDEIDDLKTNAQKNHQKLSANELQYIKKLNADKLERAKEHDEAIKKYEKERDREIGLKRTQQAMETGQARLEIERKYSEFIAAEQENQYFEKLQKTDPKQAEFERKKLDKINALRNMIDELDKLSEGKTAEELGPILSLYGQLLKEIGAVQNSTQKTDIFGMTESDWEKLKRHFDEMMDIAGELQNAWSAYNDYLSNKEQQQINNAQSSHDKQVKLLETRLNKGLISQALYDQKVAALDEDLDKKKKKIEHDQAIRNKRLAMFDIAIKTAQGVMSALAMLPPNIPLSIVVAATGAIQAAAVAAEPVPEYAKGGYINSDSIIRAGEEGREWVASNELLSDPVTAAIIADLQRIQENRKPQMIGSTPVLPDFGNMVKVSQPQPMVINHIYKPEPSPSAVGEKSNTDLTKLVDLNQKLVSFLTDPENRKSYINYNELIRTNTDLEVIQSLADMHT